MIPPLIVWVCGNCGSITRDDPGDFCPDCSAYRPAKQAALIPLADDWEPPMAAPS